MDSKIVSKTFFFPNQKKCRFHKDEVCFLKFVISFQEMSIEEEKIGIVKAWLKPKLVRDIQMFLGFTNFYKCFIKDFSKIVVSLTSMLKIITSIISANTTRKSNNHPGFLTPDTKLTFIWLRKAFIKTVIIDHFYLDCYICMKINTSSYVIADILSKLTRNSE